MAITWGAWVQNRFRCGLDITQSPTTVGSGTASVTLTFKVYIQTLYWGWDSGIQWAISGSGLSASGTTAFDHGGDMQYTLMGTTTKVINTVYGSTVSYTAAGSVTGWSAYSGTASVSKTHTIGARPYSAPAAPTSASATRVSDTQHTIAWTNNATTNAPYSNVVVQRWDNVSNAYSTIATLSGSSTSYSNTNTIANRQYRWRVYAVNSVDTSGYAYTGYLKTTPAAPTGTPVATKDASGNIVVTWTGDSAIADNHEIWHYANGVLDGAALSTTLAGNATSYTHTSPNAAQTHKYKVRAKTTTPALTGGFTADSNTVQLQAAPLAPTNLSPTGVTLDATQDITVYWQHNPVDTTAQTYRETRHRINGGAWVEPGRFATATQNRVYTANTFTNGTTVEWAVRTWGALTDLTTGASPWSATAIITMSAAPTATINTPGASVTTSSVTVSWGYYDPESTAQAAWEVRLYNAQGAVIETKTGTGTTSSTVLSTAVQNALSYTVGVKVRDTSGAWSTEDTQAFTVAFASPPQAQPTAEWIPESGSVSVETLVRTNLTRTNAITNPSFEVNTTGWSGGTSSVITRVDTEFHDGAYSLEVYCPTAGGYAQWSTRVLDADAGETWTLSCWVKGTVGADFEIEPRGQDVSNVTTNTTDQHFTLSGGWQRFSVTITYAANTDKMWPLFFSHTAGATFYLDSVMAEQTDTLMEFIEGTMVEPEAIETRAYRSIDGGETWEIFAAGLEPGASVEDPIPPLNSNVLYMVETVSATPTSARSEAVEVSTTNTTLNRVWLNFGPGFGGSVYLAPNVKIKVYAGRFKTLQQFAGRTKPVEFSSVNIEEVIDVKGLILRDQATLQEYGAATSTFDDWYDAVMKHAAPMCFRDLRGHRWFVSVESLDWDGPNGMFQEINFRAYQVDWTEPATAEEWAAI